MTQVVPPPTPLHADLAGRWAVVTGASKGIGAAIAEAFVEAGGNVVLVSRGREHLESFAGRLQQRAAEDQHIKARPADIADPTSVGELFSWLSGELPQLDIFVANAGTGSMSPFIDLPLEHPGITETPLTKSHPTAFAEAVADVPLQRAGAPRDMASAALFLCSPVSPFTTGANLVIDGGEVLA